MRFPYCEPLLNKEYIMKAVKYTKAPKAKAVRNPSVSFGEFLALRNPSNAGKGELTRLLRKNLVAVTETAETVLARETKTAIFYKKVVKRNASLTPAGAALLEALNSKL